MQMMLPRATRVSMPISVFYRHPQDDFWFSSQVVNVSESGILFGPADLTSGTLVEVMLAKKICTMGELEEMMDKIDQMDGARSGGFDPRNFGVK